MQKSCSILLISVNEDMVIKASCYLGVPSVSQSPLAFITFFEALYCGPGPVDFFTPQHF